MPTADDFRMDLHRMMNEAIHQGKATADINAGELHRRVGDVILAEPPSGQGASLTIRYVLPRPEPVP